MPLPTNAPNHRRPRWVALLTILVLAAAALVWIWTTEVESRQTRVMNSMAVGAITALLVFLWLVVLSRLRPRVRLALATALIGLGVLGAATLEPRGVSGDVVPRLAFKWTPRADERLAGTLDHRADGVAVDEAAGGFPQFLGPRRDATVRGIRLARDWSTPPALRWRQPIGAGNSGFAAVGSLAVTHEQRGEDEMVIAYDMETGAVVWSHADRARHEDLLGGDGPRATPTIADGAVYSLGATGLLSKLDLRSGALQWQNDVLQDAGAERPEYGVTASPLVLEDVVVVLAGGAQRNRGLVAYARDSGEVAWTGGAFRAAYASPMMTRLADVPQIVAFHDSGLSGHDLDGSVLWSAPWPPTQRTSQPVTIGDDRLYVSSGYGVGGKLFEIDRDPASGDLRARMVWESRGLKAKFTQVVHREGHLYGLDDGILACLDVETGERCWKGGRYGHGQILLVDDLILILSEKGSVALVAADPSGYQELGRFEAISGKTWNTPALVGHTLLVRNGREAACFTLPLADDGPASPDPG